MLPIVVPIASFKFAHPMCNFIDWLRFYRWVLILELFPSVVCKSPLKTCRSSDWQLIPTLYRAQFGSEWSWHWKSLFNVRVLSGENDFYLCPFYLFGQFNLLSQNVLPNRTHSPSTYLYHLPLSCLSFMYVPLSIFFPWENNQKYQHTALSDFQHAHMQQPPITVLKTTTKTASISHTTFIHVCLRIDYFSNSTE